MASGIIKAGVLPPAEGGTGQSSLAEACNSLMVGEAMTMTAGEKVTIVRGQAWRYGSLLTINARITIAEGGLVSNADAITLPSDVRFGTVQDVLGHVIDAGPKNFYVPAGAPAIRANGAIPAGTYVIQAVLHLITY